MKLKDSKTYLNMAAALAGEYQAKQGGVMLKLNDNT